MQRQFTINVPEVTKEIMIGIPSLDDDPDYVFYIDISESKLTDQVSVVVRTQIGDSDDVELAEQLNVDYSTWVREGVKPCVTINEKDYVLIEIKKELGFYLIDLFY